MWGKPSNARVSLLALGGVAGLYLLAFLAPVRAEEKPSTDTKAIAVKDDPGTLTGFRGENGKVLYFEVTGTNTGSVWGTDTYTDDSKLSTAAVHAGAIALGKTAVVKVTVVEGQASYKGSERNGVTTADWGEWVGSYRVEAAGKVEAKIDVRNDPGNLSGFRGQNGKVLYIEVTGQKTGRIWGTDTYTDDSSLATAAVHAGLVPVGKTAVVKVTIVEGQASYKGSERNDVASSDYGEWAGSYRLAAADKVPKTTVRADPGTLTGFRGQNGKVLYFEVTGTNTGSVWGTDTYTDDSKLSTAAVHAGVVPLGKKAVVKVTMVEGQASYKGSERNGVATSDWGEWVGSYRIEAVK